MADSAAKTTVLVELLERMQDGDLAASDELIRAFQGRLEQLARKMFVRHPGVGRWVEEPTGHRGKRLQVPPAGPEQRWSRCAGREGKRETDGRL
jgi:hypothetical protein